MSEITHKRRYFAPLAIIPHRPDEEPLICLQVNQFWIAYLLFAIDPGRYPESWLGTLDENRQARNDVKRLIEMLILAMEDCDMKECCQEPLIIKRVDPTTLQLQVSSDNGTTWTPDPGSPIIQAVQRPPLASGNKCDAATNAKEHIEDVIAGVHENLSTAQTVFDLAVGVCAVILDIALIIISGGLAAPALIAAATALATAVWEAAHALFELGITGYDAYWTQTERDKILCALYCSIGNNGQWTDPQYSNFLAQWQSLATPGIPYNMVRDAVRAVGRVGLNNMASYGNAADADCSSCQNCATCDLNHWSIFEGIGTDIVKNSTEGWIQVTAVQAANGRYYAMIATDDYNNHCCTLLHIDATPAIAGNAFIWRCGVQPDTAVGYEVWFDPQHAWTESAIQSQDALPFTVRWTLGSIGQP